MTGTAGNPMTHEHSNTNSNLLIQFLLLMGCTPLTPNEFAPSAKEQRRGMIRVELADRRPDAMPATA
jgi:hypothetical protein